MYWSEFYEEESKSSGRGDERTLYTFTIASELIYVSTEAASRAATRLSNSLATLIMTVNGLFLISCFQGREQYFHL